VKRLALCVLLAACGKPGDPPPTPKSAPSIGRLPPAAPDVALPKAAAGWTPCSSDTGPAISADEAPKRRAAWHAKPSAPSLHARPATAKRDGNDLAIGKARLGLHSWTKVVLTSHDVDAQATSTGEWDEFYAGVVNALFPRDGFIAYVAEHDARDKSTYTGLTTRVYVLSETADVVADTIAKSAPTLLGEAACVYDESSSHRDQWRFERIDGKSARRALLSANLHYADYGGDASVDLRILPDVEGGTLVIACLYAGGDASKSCDAFAASLKIPH
jgi:hypothetical protein